MNRAYANRNKVSGLLIDDEQVKEKIYQQYLEAFKKGVYNYIKEDYDSKLQTEVPRKYFSGGVVGHIAAKNINFRDLAQLSKESNVLDRLHLKNVFGDVGLVNQNGKEDDSTGGLMGRWEFQGINYLNSNGLLKLLSPKRIPNKNGVIEDEFKELQEEITLQTVSLENKNLNGREGIGSAKIAEIKALLKDMGLQNIKFRVIRRDHKASVKYRIYGIGYKQADIPIIAIREDILTRGNLEQIREALEHEKAELEGKEHKEIRAQQTDRGLRNLIRSLSNEDKVDVSFYNQESNYRNNLDLLMTVLTDPKAQFFNRNSAAEILKERDNSKEEYERILPGLIGAINDETLEGYTKRDVLASLTKAASKVDKDIVEQRIKPAILNLLGSKDPSIALAAFDEIKKLDPRFENVIPLDIVFKYEIDSWSARAESKKIKMLTEFPDGNLFIQRQRTFSADLKGGVIQELIVNALKYTPEGGTITIVLKQEGDQVIFSVKDTGIGIPDADKEKVWRQGYRSPNAQAADEGTGLGLPIMRSTVLNYGGSINFESQEGKGTTFTVQIPRGDVPDFAMQSINEERMQGAGANKTKKDLAMISSAKRDGVILSKKGNAPEEFVSNTDQLSPLDFPRFNDIIQYLTPRIKKLEEQTPENDSEKENLPKIKKAVKSAMDRLVQAHEQRKIFSRPMIVHGKENFAAGILSEDRLIIADELQNLDIPQLAEYLLHLVIDFGNDNWIWWRARSSIFEENKKKEDAKKLGDEVEQIVKARAAVHNGVDHRASINQAIDALTPHPTAVLTDATDVPVDGRGSSYSGSNMQEEFREMLHSNDQFVMYGQWGAVGMAGNAFGEVEERVRQKKNIKVALSPQGLVGIWDAPSGVNEIIQRVFSARGTTTPVMVDITPLSIMIGFYALNYPYRDEILTNYINSVIASTSEPFLSYEMFRGILSPLMARHEEIDKQLREMMARDEHGYHKLEDKNSEIEAVVARMFGLLEPSNLTSHFRQFFIENHSDARYISATLETILRDRNERYRSQEMLWEIYLNPENASEDDNRFAGAILDIDRHEYDSKTLWKIFHILAEGNLIQSNKAIQIFLGLEINREKQKMLYELLSVAGSYREMVAAYTMVHVKLFGVETETTRDGYYGGDDDDLKVLPSAETRNVYYYLMNTDAILKQGGVANRDVDNRIFNNARFLDNNSRFPGEHGRSWFSVLRLHIHNSVDDNSLYFVAAILGFWRNLDDEIFDRVSRERRASWGIFDTIAQDSNRQEYSGIINNLLNLLRENGEIGEHGDAIEQIAHLEEEHVVEILSEANPEADSGDMEKVEYMLRLYFALSEKYSTNLPRAVQQVREAGKLDEWHDHGRGDYLDFARQEYTTLTQALDATDERKTFEAVTGLRLAIRNYLLSHSGQTRRGRGGEDDQQNDAYKARRLSELDHHLQMLGRHYLNNVFNQHLQNMTTIEEIHSNIDLLISIAKFIQSEGLGAVDFEQYINELENGTLTNAQLYDLVRAFQGETLKAIGQLNKNVRFVALRILNGKMLHSLNPRWAGLIKFEKEPITVDDQTWDRDVVTPESLKTVENTLVDDLVRESGLDVFKEALAKFEGPLLAGISRGSEVVLEKQRGESTSLDQKVMRFGQGLPVQASERLLGRWGKKGLNLDYMGREGVRVPAGFIIDSQLANQLEVLTSDSFRSKLAQEIKQLRGSTGDTQLLFARSGSAFMLPGLLMTIANIGMNDHVAEEMASRIGDQWFAYDTYATFIRSFGIHVLGIDEKYFAQVLDIYTKDQRSGEEMKQAVEGYKEVIRRFGGGRQIPENIVDQVTMASQAIYTSWNSPKAKEYRERHGLSDNWGTPVIVQKGILGNRSGTEDRQHISGAGSAVLLTDPQGRPVLRGEFRPRGQGDLIMSEADSNVIAMSRVEGDTRRQSLEDLNPELYQKLLASALRLKEIFGYDQLFEFAIERGEPWITQSNDDFDNDDAPQFVDSNQTILTRGKGLSGGAVRGWIAHSIPMAKELFTKYRRLLKEGSQEVKDVDGVILLLDRVSPEMMNHIPQGVHILAKKLSVHAVSLAQEGGLTVVAEVPNEQMTFDEIRKTWIVAGKYLTDGEIISMDGHRNPLTHHNSGNIYLGSVPLKSDKAMNTKQEILFPDKIQNGIPENLGEKPEKLIRLKQAGFNIPKFFVIKSNGSGELILNDQLNQAFNRMNKPVIVRSAHPEEGKKYSYSGVFESFSNIEVLRESEAKKTVQQHLDDFDDVVAESVEGAYKEMVALAGNSYRANKYREANKITEFNPNLMNAVVMEQVDVDVFGMFVTSDIHDPNKVLIHYKVRTPPGQLEAGGVITYNKNTASLEENKLSEHLRGVLIQFGKNAEKIESIFGRQQIELASSKTDGKVYVFQSRTINLGNPNDVPRYAQYKTMSQEDRLTAIGYGSYHLPVLVVDTVQDAMDYKHWPEYQELLAKLREAKGETERDGINGQMQEIAIKAEERYKEELTRFKEKNPQYILVIKDADSVVHFRGKSIFEARKDYSFLNGLISNAKVIVRGKNQNAIRHEDWDHVDLGGITLMPSSDDRFVESFHHKFPGEGSYKRQTGSGVYSVKGNISFQHSRSIATGDYLNVLSNIDGAFIWYDDKAQLTQQGSDKALISNPGGIDLTSKRYKISINSDGREIKMDFDQAMLNNLQFNGVEFKINRIDPILNPQKFLMSNLNN